MVVGADEAVEVLGEYPCAALASSAVFAAGRVVERSPLVVAGFVAV